MSPRQYGWIVLKLTHTELEHRLIWVLTVSCQNTSTNTFTVHNSTFHYISYFSFRAQIHTDDDDQEKQCFAYHRCGSLAVIRADPQCDTVTDDETPSGLVMICCRAGLWLKRLLAPTRL